MTDFWRVIRFELWRMSRRRAYLIMTFVVPALAIAAFYGFQAYQDWQAGRETAAEATAEEPEDFGLIGYVDHSGMFESPGLFATAMRVYDGEDSAFAAMDDGEVSTVYVIAQDYLETGAVTRYLNDFSLNGLSADSFFRTFLYNRLLQGVDENLAARLNNEVRIVTHQVAQETGEATVAQNEDASFLLVYVFGLMMMLTTFISGGYVLQSVVEEKENRMIEIIMSAVRPIHLLGGKILASGALGLAQILIWFGTGVFLLNQLDTVMPFFSDVNVSVSIVVWAVLYFIGAFAMFAGAYASVGALSQSMREGPQMAVVFTLPAAIPFYFLTMFIETPNGSVPTIMSLFPITAPLSMIMRLSVTAVPLVELMISIVLIFLTALGMVWLAARLFRVSVLLAGQAPKWRDIVRIVRED